MHTPAPVPAPYLDEPSPHSGYDSGDESPIDHPPAVPTDVPANPTIPAGGHLSFHTPILFTLGVAVVVVLVSALVGAHFAFGLEPTFTLWAVGVGVIVAGVLLATVVNQIIFRRWLKRADSTSPTPDGPSH